MIAAFAALSLLGGYSSTESFSFGAGPAPVVSVQTFSGSIVVKTGGSQILVDAEKRSQTRAGLKALRVVAASGERGVTIRVVDASGCAKACGDRVSFVLLVPAGTSLNLETVSGDIDASGLSADANLSCVTGSLTAAYAGVTGVHAIRLRSEVGRVSLELPGNAALGRVVLKTLVGRVNSDWPVAASNAFVVGESAGEALPGTISVELTTYVGGIYLKKG